MTDPAAGATLAGTPERIGGLSVLGAGFSVLGGFGLLVGLLWLLMLGVPDPCSWPRVAVPGDDPLQLDRGSYRLGYERDAASGAPPHGDALAVSLLRSDGSALPLEPLSDAERREYFECGKVGRGVARVRTPRQGRYRLLASAAPGGAPSALPPGLVVALIPEPEPGRRIIQWVVVSTGAITLLAGVILLGLGFNRSRRSAARA